MSHPEIQSGKEPIRLFDSDFLEFFSHIHPAVVFFFWLPIIVFFLLYSIFTTDTSASYLFIPICYVIGLFLWTLMEYVLHRFLFHFKPRTKRQERISFLFHGVHHAQPMSKTRLVMPPAVSLLLAAVSFGLFALVIGLIFNQWHWLAPVFSGLLSGYLTYDMLHYGMHHIQIRSKALKFVRKHHMQHHAKTPDMRFGVSSPLWDFVFRTYPKD